MAKSSTMMWMIIMLPLLFLVISNCEAKEHLLVGNNEQSWRLPLHQAEWLNQWLKLHERVVLSSNPLHFDGPPCASCHYDPHQPKPHPCTACHLSGAEAEAEAIKATKEHLVGNSEQSWQLPLHQAQRPRNFVTGDSLLWKQEQGWGSVLQVKEGDYHNCNKWNPIQSYSMKVGDDVRVVLKKPGSFYFISGTQGLCEQGMKLHVRVLSSYGRFQGNCGVCHPAGKPISNDPN